LTDVIVAIAQAGATLAGSTSELAETQAVRGLQEGSHDE
jgi:hypothetical protein